MFVGWWKQLPFEKNPKLPADSQIREYFILTNSRADYALTGLLTIKTSRKFYYCKTLGLFTEND
jgi:hypothetical protein